MKNGVNRALVAKKKFFNYAAKSLQNAGGGNSHRFLFALLILLTLGVGNVWGEKYFKIHVKAVSSDGTIGKVYACTSTDYYNDAYPTTGWTDEYTTDVISIADNAYPNVYILAQESEGVYFVGWYDDEACENLTFRANSVKESSQMYEDKASMITTSTNPAEAPIRTFYAKFTNRPNLTYYAILNIETDAKKRGAFKKSSWASQYVFNRSALTSNIKSREGSAQVTFSVPGLRVRRGYLFDKWEISDENMSYASSYTEYSPYPYVNIYSEATTSGSPAEGTIRVIYDTCPDYTLTVQKAKSRGKVTISYKNYFENAGGDQLVESTITDSADVAISEESRTYHLYSSDKITLTAVPEPGYEFDGWYYVEENGEKTKIQTGATLSDRTLSENTTLLAYFTRPIAETDNFLVGMTTCQTLEQAIAAASSMSDKTILQIRDYAIPEGNYTIPQGVTLLVPCDAEQADPSIMVERTTNEEMPESAYRTLTLASGAHLDVYGTIEVSGKQSTGSADAGADKGVGRPSAPTYGHMVLNSGSSITLNSGATFRAWGFVTGSGEIDARRGSKVFEQFQVMDWRGKDYTMAILNTDHKVLPMTQYYIQNIESPTVYHPGAKLYGATAVRASASIMSIVAKMDSAGIIGVYRTDADKDPAIFLMNDEDDSEDTWVRKYYDAEHDQQVYEVNNKAYLGSLVMKFEALGLGVTLNSTLFVLPITNNFKIHLLSGEMNITQNTVLLPGAEIELDKKSTVFIPDTATLSLYDSEQWGAYVCNHWNSATSYTFGYGTRVKYRPGGVPNVRDISTKYGQGDAKLTIHGTVNIEGRLFTTEGGAAITSTIADAGTIIFTNAAPTFSTDHYVEQVSSTDPTYVAAQCVSGLLTNDASSAYGEFSQTAGTPAGKSFCFMDMDGDGLGEWVNLTVGENDCFAYDQNDVYYIKPKEYVAISTGAPEPQADHTYKAANSDRIFIHNLIDGNCQWWEVEKIEDNLFHCLNPQNDKYYYYDNGEWQEKKFKVSWVNWDGSPVKYKPTEGDSCNYYMVTYNTTPQWLSSNPTRANDASHEYSFLGWMPDLAPVTADITYMAKYQERDKMYAITFNDAEDALIELTYCKLGEMPVCSRYTLAANEEWKTAEGELPLGAVSKDEVYKLFSKDTEGPFTIRFVNWNGEELQSCSVAKNSNPVYGGATPSKPGDASHAYSFVGWTPSIAPATENMTYTAKYEVQEITGLNVLDAQTITSDLTIPTLRVATTGTLNINNTGAITTTDFILESTTNVSGQLVGAPRLTVNGKAYFDVQFNGNTGTANRTWYAIAVPWEVDAENGILWKEGDRKLVLGRDFDLVWYDGSVRAAQGDGYACWKYLEDETDKMMHPGKAYMMYFGSQFQTVRFEKHEGKPIVYTESGSGAVTSVATYDLGTDNANDGNWNGIANPSLCHAYLNAGVSYGQVLNNGSLDDYQVNHPEGNPVYRTKALSTYKFVVGKPVFVQAESAQSFTVNPTISGAFDAPKRERSANTPDGIDAVFAVTIGTETNHEADNLFIQVTEEEKEDRYVIGQDLAKGGVAKTIPQLWVNRYNSKLSVNTQALTNDAAEYPLTLFAPVAGEYQISNVQSQMSNEDYTLYLTFNGEAIWNLSDAAYTFSLPQGNTTEYGLRVSAHTPQITTGIDEAIVDANGETQKVIINNQVFIIREGQLYTVDGRMVK